MRKILFGLLFLTLFINALVIDECKVDLYYATDIILPEDEENSESDWKEQAELLLEKYPQLEDRIGERKVAYNISEGVISDLFVKTKENLVAGITWTAFRIWALTYIKSKAAKFVIAQADAASLMIYNGTLKKQIESYNKSIESGHGVVVIAHSLGNLFTEGVFKKFEENDEKWKQDYFHTIAVASTQSDIINGGHGITFDNDIVYLAEPLKANEDVKIRNPNRHDWGYKNAVNEYVLNEDFWSSEYHKFEYYLGYTVMETTRLLEGYNTVESKPRQTNIAKDMIIQWMYDEIVAHETRDSQWETDQESNKDTKDYKITVKHKFDPSNIVMNQEVYPFNTSKKLYSVNGEYVKASCGGKNITESDESWIIDNPKEERIEEKEKLAGVVVDKNTNLMWQDLYEAPYTHHYGTFSNAIYYCKTLSLAGYNDWRVPKVNEFEEMYNTGLINKFVHRPYSEQWSITFSHVYNGWGGAKWYFTFDFLRGKISESKIRNKESIMCVRDL